MKRTITLALWALCAIHLAANIEAWWQNRRAGQPFRWLP